MARRQEWKTRALSTRLFLRASESVVFCTGSTTMWVSVRGFMIFCKATCGQSNKGFLEIWRICVHGVGGGLEGGVGHWWRVRVCDGGGGGEI
jgi:hypothetical protein